MATIYVYNNRTNSVERYYRGLLEAMPYVTGRTMTVGEFRGSSRSNILWTTKEMLEAWNSLRAMWGKPIFIGYAFRRIWEGGHSAQSQHYAGTALDVGHTMTAAQRQELWNLARRSGLWSYVEPLELTPRWVHLDKRYGTPACPTGGYPKVSLGSRGVYVFVLQDALSALGFTGGGLDGIFGSGTKRAVTEFQASQGLVMDGIVGCATWSKLAPLANGIGQTSTVIL